MNKLEKLALLARLNNLERKYRDLGPDVSLQVFDMKVEIIKEIYLIAGSVEPWYCLWLFNLLVWIEINWNLRIQRARLQDKLEKEGRWE